MRVTTQVAAVLLLSAAPAFAQEPASGPEPAPAGTSEGAKAVVDGLVPYLGRTAFDSGTLKVEPDPAGYRITVDLKPLLDNMKSGETRFSLSPYSFVVSQRGDGNWNTFSDSPIDVTAHVSTNGIPQDISYDIGAQRFKGVYSPAIAAYLSGSGSIDRFGMRTSDPNSDVVADFGRMTYDLSGAPAENGSADLSIRQTLAGFVETVTMKQLTDPQQATGAPVSVGVKAADGTNVVSMKGARTRPLVDLYGFFVAHPEYLDGGSAKAKLGASQNDLKARLRAALPLWNRVDGNYVLNGIEIDSQFGRAKADRFSLALNTDGVSKAGTVGYSFGFGGLDLASPMLPAWTKSLIPTEMDLRLKLDNLDLQTPAEIFLADLDLTRPEPVSTDARDRIEASFASNPPRFVIEPSRIKSQDLEVAMSGSFAMSTGKPAATVDITATGLEKAISTLQSAAATQPEINQTVGMLSIAKGFGKTLPDGRVQWVVDASSDGSVKINGFQVKTPDPVAVPDQDTGGDDGATDDEDAAPDGDGPENGAPTDDNAVPSVPQQP